MILTVTLNPSLDRTFAVDELRRGEVLRVSPPLLDPGGKGINVARALTANNIAARAILPMGGTEGHQLVELLARAGVPTSTVPIADTLRSNITIVESNGTVTKLNEPGPHLRRSEIDALLTCIEEASAEARWIVISGSLPPGSEPTLLTEIVSRAHAADIRVAVDTSGKPLLAALDAHPDLIKPNRDELAEATSSSIMTIGDVVGAAQQLRAQGAGAVLTSLGKDGAVLVTDQVILHAHAHATRTDSSVGAGDATLAGYLAAEGDPSEALRSAVAYGTAAVQLPGSQMPGPHDLDPGKVQLRGAPDRLQLLTLEGESAATG